MAGERLSQDPLNPEQNEKSPKKYFTTTSPIHIDNKSRFALNAWSYLRVTINQRKENGSSEIIGSYERNYSYLFDTFYPFKKNGKEYAFYSPDYRGTRMMELPSCKDIGGEEPDPQGSCPVEYYIPEEENEDASLTFVSTRVWGEDPSSLQFLDLSQIEKGIIKCDERFGYLVLPENIALKDAITIDMADKDDGEILIFVASQVMFRADLNGNITRRSVNNKWVSPTLRGNFRPPRPQPLNLVGCIVSIICG